MIFPKKRTKCLLHRVTLDKAGWAIPEGQSFGKSKNILKALVPIAHRDHKRRLCFYVDNADRFRAGIATQALITDFYLLQFEKRHKQLAFLSGHFNKTQLRWSVLKKETSRIMETVERMHWIASCPEGFDLLTNNRNVIFIIDLLCLALDLGQSSIREVVRWRMCLCAYN